MKKKLITVLLCLTLGLAATACGAGKGGEKDSNVPLVAAVCRHGGLLCGGSPGGLLGFRRPA